MKRYLADIIAHDLKKKMVFLGGPRQVGKTTLALGLLGSDETDPAYLNWDFVDDKRLLLKGLLPGNRPLIILDEIHKYKQWRDLLKGLYDKNRSTINFLVTGSARLDFYRKGGDSLQGRYHYFRLHPLSLYELNSNPTIGDLNLLLKFGGFPEPFLLQSEKEWKRWQRDRLSLVVKEDLVSLENVREVSQLETLAVLLQEKIGSLLSVNSLRKDLAASHEAVERWVMIFENLFYCFRIRPFMADRIAALKKDRKLYLWDWSIVASPGARFENLVAANLLKYCHFLEDSEGDNMELCFLRDKYKREIDFVVVKNGRPVFAVECKTGESDIARAIPYFAARTEIPWFYQVHPGEKDFVGNDLRLRMLPFPRFASEILKI